MIRFSSIAAMAQNRVIGKDGDLPWHISEDLKHFKRTTLGKPIIMGRKSFDAFGGKPLPKRANIVISRSYDQTAIDYLNYNYTKTLIPFPVESDLDNKAYDFSATLTPFPVKSIDEGIALGRMIAQETGQDEMFITGGGEIYKQTMSRIDRLYLSVIERDYEGDTLFPEFDWDDFTINNKTHHEGEPSFTIYTLDRKKDESG